MTIAQEMTNQIANGLPDLMDAFPPTNKGYKLIQTATAKAEHTFSIDLLTLFEDDAVPVVQLIPFGIVGNVLSAELERMTDESNETRSAELEKFEEQFFKEVDLNNIPDVAKKELDEVLQTLPKDAEVVTAKILNPDKVYEQKRFSYKYCRSRYGEMKLIWHTHIFEDGSVMPIVYQAFVDSFDPTKQYVIDAFGWDDGRILEDKTISFIYKVIDEAKEIVGKRLSDADREMAEKLFKVAFFVSIFSNNPLRWLSDKADTNNKESGEIKAAVAAILVMVHEIVQKLKRRIDG